MKRRNEIEDSRRENKMYYCNKIYVYIVDLKPKGKDK